MYNKYEIKLMILDIFIVEEYFHFSLFKMKTNEFKVVVEASKILLIF